MSSRPTHKPMRIAAALIVSICGSMAVGGEVYVAESYTSPDVEVNEVEKILVIGITADQEARRNFENRFVSHLRGRKYDGVTSHSLVADLGRIEDRREVLDKIAELQVDSALTVRVVPLVDDERREWGAIWKESLTPEGTLRQLIETSLPESQTRTRYYGVEVMLWGGEPTRRIWAGRTEFHTMKQLKKGAGDLVQDVMGTLKLARLL